MLKTFCGSCRPSGWVWGLIGWLGLAVVTFTDASAAKLIPLESLAQLPDVSAPMLSPNGRYVAATMTIDGQPRIIVHKISKLGEAPDEEIVPIGSGENHFSWYRWANDERLIVSIRATISQAGHLWNLGRMGSVGPHGESPIVFEMEPNIHGFYRQHANVVSLLDNDSDHILAALDDDHRGWGTPQVHRVNVNTGKKTLVQGSVRGVHNWIADEDGQVRVGTKVDTKYERRNVTVYYRENELSDWVTLQKVDYFDHDRLLPYRFDEDDPSILLVTSANLQEDQDPDEIEGHLYRYDLSIRNVIGPYEDTYRKSVIEAVEKALPEMKVKIISHDDAKNTYIFRVYSDVQAPEYYIFDIEKRALNYLASEYPDLNDYELAPMERVTYEARDGLEIPAFLTIPAGAERKNLPVVVYPHGGPWARDRWGFDNYVQFMANRGYAVFQPQFRGSTGYGIEHEEAGYGEWGYGIQDDITDGVEWLIEQGIADAGRICIVGASFGGYAAAMGAVKTPDLYQCAVSINGVLDLKKMIDSGRYTMFETINRAVWNDRADAESASPYHQAEGISASVLLIGSERDTVVPVEHSVRMYKRMRRLKEEVTYIELPDGEHWRTNEENEIKVFAALEKFLAAHIGSERSTDSSDH